MRGGVRGREERGGKTELALILPHLNTDRQSREGKGEEYVAEKGKREDKSEKREAGRGGYGELKSERRMGCGGGCGTERTVHLVR